MQIESYALPAIRKSTSRRSRKMIVNGEPCASRGARTVREGVASRPLTS